MMKDETASEGQDIRREEERSAGWSRDSFLGKYGPALFVGLLALYVVLLAIGTYAELTHNETLLDWWIFQ